jgi:NAD(P)-dependent dehydrogenase (short-subunit alcohol dehydrogenase family)
MMALVTGAANGIGRAIALRLAADGMSLAAFDVDGRGLDDLVSSVKTTGAAISTHVVDIGDLDALSNAFDDAIAHHHRLDVLVNNAATFEPDVVGRDIDIVNTPIDVFDRTMDVNVRGAYALMQQSVPVMLSTASGGSIVNISSPAAMRGAISSVAYSASKAALEALTRSVATSHGRAGIRCNTVAVGLVMTDNARKTLKGLTLQSREANLLVPRLGEPDDAAGVVSLLASPAGSYINGQTIVLDGGASAHQPWFAFGPDIIPDYAATADPTPAPAAHPEV